MSEMAEGPASSYVQLQHWSVCQVCGVCVPRGTDDWIDSPCKADPSYRIVRCPAHWSEWALRSSEMGRTRANMRQLYRLRREHPEGSPMVMSWPIPLVDEPCVGPMPGLNTIEGVRRAVQARV